MKLIPKDSFIYANVHWLLRLVLAATFVLHGYTKFGYDMGMGVIGYFVGPFEVFGGIFLIVGPLSKDIITRLGGLMIAIIMSGAIFKYHFHQGYKMHSTVENVPHIMGYEWQAILLVVALLFVVKGNDV